LLIYKFMALLLILLHLALKGSIMTPEQMWFFGIIGSLIMFALSLIISDVRAIKSIAISNAKAIAGITARVDNQEKMTDKIPCLNSKPCYTRSK
jgi:lipid-A-disaccharide synthase-like uncharacterized protein